MDDIALVKVVHSIQHLPDCLRSILLCEFAVLANPVKQLTTSGQLSDNVEFVLVHQSDCDRRTVSKEAPAPTLDSNQSTK